MPLHFIFMTIDFCGGSSARRDDNVKAILLSAGQGTRLAPITTNRPKCLVPLAGRTLLEHQVRSLSAAGVAEIVVVTGFAADMVERELTLLARDYPVKLRTIHNPFYLAADNLGSCWVARSEMTNDFLLLNGDTLLEPAAIAQVLRNGQANINVTATIKPAYDDDDMKITLRHGHVSAINKQIPADRIDAESVGMILFRNMGPRQFVARMEAIMREPEALRWYYLKAVEKLAQDVPVDIVDISGYQTAEVDFLPDIPFAENVVRGWENASATMRAAVA
jgi:L-glutamine-phosphate cytidylyltransferase